MERKVIILKGRNWYEITAKIENGCFTASGSYGEVLSYSNAVKQAENYWLSFFKDNPKELGELIIRFDQAFTPKTAARFVLVMDGELHGLDVHHNDSEKVYIVEGCGQCFDAFPLKSKGFRSFLAIWQRWHLNDMHAGCEHQRALGWEKDGYDKHPSEPCPTCGYKFGTAWKKEELPSNLARQIDDAFNAMRQGHTTIEL